MTERDYGDFVQDILDSINDVRNFIGEMDFENFIKDKKTIYSVVRARLWDNIPLNPFPWPMRCYVI